MPHPSIFISYRRDDTLKEARQLNTELINYFGPGSVFFDKKRLEAGMVWPEELETNVRNARVLLVLIRDEGKWLGVDKLGFRRTDEPTDWVRLEIETARAAEKIIIPVFLEGGALTSPKALPKSLLFLCSLQGYKISAGWDNDVVGLCQTLEKHVPRLQTNTPLLHPLADYPLPEGLDPFDKYQAPYLGLQYFDRPAARLFFGRTRELLDFFGRVENPDIRLICLYGHSGVGKSSFLAAGVRPRLEGFRAPHYDRRRKTEGLGKQLDRLRQSPPISSKAPVYILDQAEEMFTDPLPGELDRFVKSLREALRAEPQATFVLGFRSDYLLDMTDLLACVDCRREDLPLRPLDQAALVEAIEGVWRDDTLRQRYQFELDPGFAAYVARDLLQSESGGATSILQNRLLKLYTEVRKHRTAADPVVRLRIEDYQQLKQNAAAEEELLDFQLQRLSGEGLPANTDDRTILEALNRFVVDKPTAGTVLKNQLPPDLDALHNALRRVNLLTELPENQAIRLSHDLLAPIVRRRYSRFLANVTERLEIENVRLRLREVRKYLLDVHFAEALAEFRMAALRNVLPEEIWPLAFELAFVFLQASKREDGVYALLSCVEYQIFAGLVVPPFPDKAFPDHRDCPELLQFLRRCDPALFIRLEARYFPVMVHIDGGHFEMGDVLGDQEYDDETVHPVTLDAFELATTPTTWQQYGLFCLATERDLPYDEDFGRSDKPVINISWYDAAEYANWLSQAKGLNEAYLIDKNEEDPNNHNRSDDIKWTVMRYKQAEGFRLPTESEWEFAARERGRHVRFGNGKDYANALEMNFNARDTNKKGYFQSGEPRNKTNAIQQFVPNALKLYDMSGNVWEWCTDWYGKYPSGAQINPTGPELGLYRVHRGGGWRLGALHCRVASRHGSTPSNRNNNLGFRLASSPQLNGRPDGIQ